MKTTTPRKRPGPVTLYPDKVRIPIALQMPADLHAKLERNATRTKVRRGDFLCRLVDKYADKLQISETEQTVVATIG